MLITLVLCALGLSQALGMNSNVFRLEPVTIIEEPAIGTLIIDLASKLDIYDLATSDYKFRFYSPHSPSAHYFLIDQLTGHVKTQRSLDREYLCETKACGPCTMDSKCSLPIQIVVGTSTTTNGQKQNRNVQQRFVSFDVVIEDKNEFAPKFQTNELVININENTPVDFTIPIEPAVDRDSRQSEIIYSIVPVDDYNQEASDPAAIDYLNSRVRLETSSSIHGQQQPDSFNRQKLNLVILKPFDYETEKSLKFLILAADSASGSSKTSSQFVTLEVIDLNDNLPVFDRLEYEYRLDESSATPGTKLIRVHATDNDDGPNGLVKYSIVDATIQSDRVGQQSQAVHIKNLFQIDETNGWIRVHNTAHLDYEQIPTYRLTIKAQDQGLSNSMPVYTNVIIYLNDVNDNPPVVTLTLPSTIDDFDTGNYEKEAKLIRNLDISEWTRPDTFLAQVKISDADSNLNSKLKITLSQLKRSSFGRDQWTASNDFALVHLFNNIYSLMTKERLDRETFDIYSLNITVSDSGQPKPLYTTHELTVAVKDENDNKPIFINENEQEVKAYEFNMVELKQMLPEKWVQIGSVLATDKDISHNGQITYELKPLNTTNCSTTSNLFKVNAKTGVVKAKESALDREICDKYEFNIIARDNYKSVNGGSVSNVIEAVLTVNLIDLNDNAPVFEQDFYRFEIVENLNAITFGKVRASDADKPNSKNSLIKYKFANDMETNGFFRVDELTGDLILLRSLDYEYATIYELDIIAYDKNNETNSLNSTCTIRVDVLDTNDNPPVLNSPRDADMPIVVSLNTLESNDELTARLFNLNVTDLDSSLFGTVRFKLEKQVKLQQFNFTKDEGVKKTVSRVNEVDFFECDQHGGISARFGPRRFKRNVYHKIGHRVQRSHDQVHHSPNGVSKWAADENLVGIYALVIRMTDGDLDTFQFNTRAYIFIALTGEDMPLKTEISYLKDLVSHAQLNIPKQPSTTHNSKFFNSQNSKFNRLITMYSMRSRPVTLSGTNLAKLGTQLMRALDGKNFKYFLGFSVIACFMIVFIIASLCISCYWYKQRHSVKSIKAKALMNTTGSSDMPTSANGSTSPSSLTSSELVDHYLSSDENLKYSLSRNKTINIYDNYESRLIRSPCHQNGTLKSHRSKPIGEEQEVLIIAKSDEKSNDCTDRLLVQVSSFENKKNVASQESLTSYNSNNSTAKTSTTSAASTNPKIQNLTQSPNSFRTFKSNHSPSTTQENTSFNSNSYRTMPSNGYRNLSDVSTPKKQNLDQKPLNLPVNELFKRYELKKQAQDSGGNSLTSSSIHSSLTSLPNTTQLIQSPQKQFNLQLINENTNQVPDYFFKDEKEFKKLVANNKKQNINIKKVIHDSPKS